MDTQILEDLKKHLVKELNEAGECFMKHPSQNLNYSIYILLKNIRYLNNMLDENSENMESRASLWN